MNDFLKCKGIYAYNYYNYSSRLDKEKLPPIEAFYNSLTDSQCTNVNFEFAKRVWAKGGCKNGWNYFEMYLASDV